MKVFICVAAAAVLISASGCSQRSKAPEIQIPSKINCSVSIGSENYKCEAEHLGDKIDTVTVTSPDTLKGIRFSRTDSGYTISRGELICRSEKILLPEYCFVNITREVIDSLRAASPIIPEQDPAGGYSYNGAVSGASYTLKTDDNGNIKELMIKYNK